MAKKPAWSWQFAPDQLQFVKQLPPLDQITPEWAWGGSTGKGVRVGIIDSGVDNEHPMVDGRVMGYARFAERPDGTIVTYDDAHEDSYGHGTACAGIIRTVAPDVEIHSIKVLGAFLSGKGTVFAAGMRWAVEQRLDVVNLSLGSTKRDFFAIFHELADQAYFNRVMFCTAANNMPVPSFPSLYAAVFSVASTDDRDPYTFYYNPSPPVEFGAPGIEVRVAWVDKGYITATGNSYACPHITGLIAKILGKHPGLTPFQVKTILWACAANVRYTAEELGIPEKIARLKAEEEARIAAEAAEAEAAQAAAAAAAPAPETQAASAGG